MRATFIRVVLPEVPACTLAGELQASAVLTIQPGPSRVVARRPRKTHRVRSRPRIRRLRS
jgi:hypothetical protein